ncbi:Aminopeptidase Y [Nakaseomyces bracarensis]|uniref:Peptide hydrolase n=1 Tax=Nakaseomyces bracarensis TaxID=273131 RepID=A0ABR4P0C9_9SACH
MKLSSIAVTAALVAYGAALPVFGTQQVFDSKDISELVDTFEENVPFYDEEDDEVRFDKSNNWLSFLPKPHVPYILKPIVESDKLQDKIELDDLNSTARDFYKLAKKSKKKFGHPTRVIGSPGHGKTIDYILDAFDGMKDYYEVSVQEFDALSGKIRSFNLSDAKTGKNFKNTTAFALSPPVKPFVGRVIEIPNLGCQDKDYDAVKPLLESHKHVIALIERGKCPFGVKSSLAGKHGFHAVVIYDNEPLSLDGLHGTLGTPDNHTVSTIGVPYVVGKEIIAKLAFDDSYSLYFAMDSYVAKIKTKNIIADTKHGDENNIIGLGAHSDSVEEGPGLNDDGSGTISLLTVAKQLTHFKINNKVRFAWWAAEEEGLLGSNYYANNLTKEENLKLRVFMDYDMMASPNYEYEVYDANNTVNPRGSEELRDLYIKYYQDHKLNYTLIPFDGRSDYVGFIENGIPAGGIATGAEKKNVFNGEVLDKCYHQLCDDVSNLAWDAFLVNTKLIAHSVATYANSLEGFPERETNTTISALRMPSPQFKYRADKLYI